MDERISVFQGAIRGIRRTMEPAAREEIEPAGKQVVRDGGVATAGIDMRKKSRRRCMIERDRRQNADFSSGVAERFGNGFDAVLIRI